MSDNFESIFRGELENIILFYERQNQNSTTGFYGDDSNDLDTKKATIILEHIKEGICPFLQSVVTDIRSVSNVFLKYFLDHYEKGVDHFIVSISGHVFHVNPALVFEVSYVALNATITVLCGGKSKR
jgi:hypothetical protein